MKTARKQNVSQSWQRNRRLVAALGKSSDKEQAAAVKKNMMNQEMFNTFMPFPTASKDNEKFAATKYWRGPVWLDQALFGVEALQNYDYTKKRKK